MVVPFMSHRATLPLLSTHTRSVEPLPSKSPVPAIVQESGRTPRSTVVATLVPLSTVICTSPVEVLRQKTLPWLSDPATTRLVETLPIIAVLTTVVPFMNQTPRSPLELRQR